MSKIFSLFTGKAAKVETGDVSKLEDEKRKTKNLRVKLLETQGGRSGEEVMSVGRRDNLFGN